jgi:D-glycero-D-manno-heptose 1,7-bisphosphate phosphatase
MSMQDPGLWCEIKVAVAPGRAALFLDRDGVIVVDTNYLGRAEDVRMIDGAASAVARCNALGIPVVLVTNQSGIARGYYGWDGFQTVQATIAAALAQRGAYLDAVLACAYHRDGLEPLRVADHSWRKPSPGMIAAAASRMSIDLPRSWIIGDQVHDIAAGLAAGLAGGTLLSVRDRERSAALKLSTERFSVEVSPSLDRAVAALIESGRLSGTVEAVE